MTSLRVSTVAVLAFGLAVSACSAPQPESDSAAPPSSSDAPVAAQPEPDPAPTPAPEAEPPADAEVKTETMSLVPSELSTSEDGTRYEHCLDCMRKSATYTYCSFDKVAFDEAVGTPAAGASVTVNVEMVAVGRENSKPADPSAPQPDGGFTHLRYSCSVVSVEPSSP